MHANHDGDGDHIVHSHVQAHGNGDWVYPNLYADDDTDGDQFGHAHRDRGGDGDGHSFLDGNSYAHANARTSSDPDPYGHENSTSNRNTHLYGTFGRKARGIFARSGRRGGHLSERETVVIRGRSGCNSIGSVDQRLVILRHETRSPSTT